VERTGVSLVLLKGTKIGGQEGEYARLWWAWYSQDN
jgi:hypothetical protein